MKIEKLKYNWITQEAKNNLEYILVYINSNEINEEVGALACIPKLKAKMVNYIKTN